MVTIEEAAHLFKVSKPTVYRWVKHYAIKSRIVDGVRYLDIDGLQHAYESLHSR